VKLILLLTQVIILSPLSIFHLSSIYLPSIFLLSSNFYLIYFSISHLPKLTESKIENYWMEEKNRRGFFETYAQQMGFNPLIAQNWYSVTDRSFVGLRVCSLHLKNNIKYLKHHKKYIIKHKTNTKHTKYPLITMHS
jgi:hypothetical protein